MNKIIEEVAKKESLGIKPKIIIINREQFMEFREIVNSIRMPYPTEKDIEKGLFENIKYRDILIIEKEEAIIIKD